MLFVAATRHSSGAFAQCPVILGETAEKLAICVVSCLIFFTTFFDIFFLKFGVIYIKWLKNSDLEIFLYSIV